MAEERVNHVPTNTIPSDVPSNGVPVEQGAAAGGGMSRKEAPVGGVEPEVIINSRLIRQEMEGGVIRLPVEQFTTMVGVLLIAMGESGAGRTPVAPPPVSAEGDREATRRRGVGETNGDSESREGWRRARDREIGDGAGQAAELGKPDRNEGEPRREGARSPGDNGDELGDRPPTWGARQPGWEARQPREGS